MEKKLLVLDFKSMPYGLDITRWMGIKDKFGLLFWDSDNGGQAPYMIDKSEIETIVIDVSTEEGKQKLIEIEDKFNKEKDGE